jgi:hypothetical protein
MNDLVDSVDCWEWDNEFEDRKRHKIHESKTIKIQ